MTKDKHECDWDAGSDGCLACVQNGKLSQRKEDFEMFEKIIEDLNERFRKENMPQRLGGDEFNDLWEEELKQKLKELK